MNIKKEIQKGFTLIELLVVIAIIGILAGILFVAIDPLAQNEKATDAKKLVFVNQLVKALELYKFENTRNNYPPGDSGRTLARNDHLFEDKLKSYFNFDLSEIFGSGEFLYRSLPAPSISPSIYQSYTIAIKLDDVDKMSNDNGVHNDWYEIGPDVDHCKTLNKASFDKTDLNISSTSKCF